MSANRESTERPTTSARKVHAIDELLERATFAARGASLARRLAFAATALGGAMLVGVVVDASAALSPAALIIADLALVAAVVAGLAWIAVRVRRLRADPRHLARVLEARAGVANNQLINALEFERNGQGGAVSEELVRQTIDAGERLAPSLVAGAVVDRAAVRRALLWLPLTPAIALLLHLAVPGLFRMTLARFADPLGFHPPFTTLAFDVAIEPGVVKHGRPALIEVGVTGPVRAGAAEVVFVDESDPSRELDAVALVAEPDDEGGAERFALRIDRATESRSFVVRTPRGRSELHRLDVVPVPSFERATVTVRPPDYTRWPAVDRAFGGGDVSALRDAVVAFRATATLPLREGRLTLTAPDGSATSVALAPSPADATTVEGSLVAERGGAVELTLVGADGTPSDERRTGTLLVSEDAAPTIRVIEPEEHVYVVEGWSVDVVFEAEDDIGVERIECVRGVNGFPPSTVALEPSGGDRSRTIARAHFDTKELGARPGDLLQCFAVAWDGHPAPPHSARSSAVVIEVLSQEEYAELTRAEERVDEVAKEAAAMEEKLQALAEKREALVRDVERIEGAERSGQQQEAERQSLAERLDRYAKESESLARRMEDRAKQQPLYDAEQPWQESLKKQAEGLREQNERAKELAGTSRESGDEGKGDRGQRRATAGQKFREERDPFGEQAAAESAQMAQDLQKLASAERLLDKVEAVRQAILDQRAVADQLAEFRQRPQPTPQESLRMQDLADEQERLAERLEQAKGDLDRTADETKEILPKMSGQAKEIAAKVDESKAADDQARAAAACRNGQGRDGHESAENAARKLEGLLSECNGDPQQQSMAEDLDGCLKMPKPGLRQALQQMTKARLGAMSSMGKRGKQGGGTSGMSASASIVGPHRPQGKSDRESKKIGNDAESKVAADGSLSDLRSGGAEDISASASRGAAGAGSLFGVPSAYREDAAAYFRRIAEDAKRPSKPAAPKEGTQP